MTGDPCEDADEPGGGGTILSFPPSLLSLRSSGTVNGGGGGFSDTCGECTDPCDPCDALIGACVGLSPT